MRADVYLHFDLSGVNLTGIEKKLDQILASVLTLKQQGVKMSKELDALTQQVQQNTDLETSAITLIQGLAQQIADLKNDPAALQALSDQLSTSASNLAAAISANTPAAPAA